jgi:hypothetical protein
MNRIRQPRQATAAPRPCTPRRNGKATKHTRARVAVATTALALPLITGLVSAGPASASTTPALHLGSNSIDAWVASGGSYTPGLSNVELWFDDVTNGIRTTLEYQDGVQTSSPSVACHRNVCIYVPGGNLSAQGASYWVSVPPGGFGYPGYWSATHPLACGHSYQAFTWDRSDGLVSSNVLIEPACQVPH